MKISKIMNFCLFLLICVLAISTVSADEISGNITSDSDFTTSSDSNRNVSLDDNLEVSESSTISNFTTLNQAIETSEDKGSVNLTQNVVKTADEQSSYENGIVINKNITINGNGYSIDANNYGRIFLINSSVSVTLNNIIFINGNITSSGGVSSYGGAIYNNGGDLTVSNSTFINNIVGDYGGAIASDNGDLTITNSNFNYNTAQIEGGAIYSENGNLTISNSIFNENSANYNGGAIAIYDRYGDSHSELILNSTFTNNNAGNGESVFSSGGAIQNLYGNLIISDSKFKNNTAIYEGGAIFNTLGNLTVFNSLFDANNVSQIDKNFTSNGGAISLQNQNEVADVYYLELIENSTFTNNYASTDGGAIYSFGAILKMNNNSFINNTAQENGGAIANEGSNVTITGDSTFKNNNATNGGVIYNFCIVLEPVDEESNYTEIYVPAFMNITSAVFDNNSASDGGAIFNAYYYCLNILNSTLVNNNATKGGAIANSGNITVNKSVLKNNTADLGGAVIFNVTGNETTTNVMYSIIFDNNATNGADIYIFNNSKNPVVSLEYNWWGVNDPETTDLYWNNWTNRVQSNLYDISPLTNWINMYSDVAIVDQNKNLANITVAMRDNDGKDLPDEYKWDFTATLSNDTASKQINNNDYIVLTGNHTDEVAIAQIDYQTNIYNLSKSLLNTDSTIAIKYNQTLIVVGNLTLSNGTPIVGNVTLELLNSNGSAVESAVVSGANFTYAVKVLLDSGNYTINFVYNGTKLVWNNKTSTSVTVNPLLSYINVSVNNITYGETVKSNISLKDENGNDLTSNVTLIVSNEEKTIVNTTVEVVNGKVSYDISDLNADNYTLAVFYKGMKNILPSNNSTAFKIAKSNLTITAQNITVSYGDEASVNINTNPNITGNVTVSIDGENYIVAIKNGSGLFNVPENILPGSHLTEIYFNGDKNFYPANTTSYINVVKLNITKVSDKTSVNVGDKLTFTITVDNEGSDVSNIFVKDLLPDGMSYVSSTASKGTYNPSTGIWNIGDLASNETVTLSITVIVNKIGSVTNIATLNINGTNYTTSSNVTVVVNQTGNTTPSDNNNTDNNTTADVNGNNSSYTSNAEINNGNDSYSNVETSVSDDSLANSSNSGVAMQNTANPLFALLLVLFSLPFVRKFKK